MKDDGLWKVRRDRTSRVGFAVGILAYFDRYDIDLVGNYCMKYALVKASADDKGFDGDSDTNAVR